MTSSRRVPALIRCAIGQKWPPAPTITGALRRSFAAHSSTDGFAQAQFPYTAPNAGAPGVWQPTPPGFLPAALPGLGAVRPWVLNSGAQFRPDERPDLTSRRYAEDFNEQVGRFAFHYTLRRH
jgi:hypothetical protein